MVNNTLVLRNYNETEIIYTIDNNTISRETVISKDTFNLNIHAKLILQNTLKPISNDMLKIDIKVLNDTINTAYFLNRDVAKRINKTFYNED